jgi:hypothetical protein
MLLSIRCAVVVMRAKLIGDACPRQAGVFPRKWNFTCHSLWATFFLYEAPPKPDSHLIFRFSEQLL